MMEFVRAHMRRALPLIAGVGVVALAACEVPEAPEWDIDLSVPFSSDPIAIVDFLPSEVDTASVGGVPVFTVVDQQNGALYTLGQICQPCQVLDGAIASVPGYQYWDTIDVGLPTDVSSIEVTSARLLLTVDNGLGFDPLKPGNQPPSTVSVEVRDLATDLLLTSATLSGDTDSIPDGQITQHQLMITDATITGGVRVIFNIVGQPGGSQITIQATANLGFDAMLDQMGVAAVTAVVDNETLDEDFMVDFDEDLREEISESVQTAEYELELTHTLEIGGVLEVSIAGSQADLFSGNPATEIRLGPHSFVSNQLQTGTMTAQQIQQIAGFFQVYSGYRGVASGTGAGNTSRFTPDQALQADFKLTVTVRVGS